MENNEKGDKKKLVEDARFRGSVGTETKSVHVPVLLQEVLEVLEPKPGEFVIDGTLGAGGHAKALIEHIKPNGTFLGIDWDKEAVRYAETEINTDVLARLTLYHGNYAEMPAILDDRNLGRADILLLDLGFSTEQLTGRGFSFQKDEPLLMTYNDEATPAYTILRQLKKKELARIIKEFSDEKYADRIAEAISIESKKEPIRTTGRLAQTIRDAVPKNYESGRRQAGRGRIDPATRTFMALRIYVNDELGNLERLLKNIGEIVKIGGRVAIISFHSKEDRLVKHNFRELVQYGSAEFITKKPITPTEEEINTNPKSRSAKLRAIKII